VAVLLVAAVLVDQLFLPRLTRQGAERALPAVLGLPLAQAEQALRDEGFQPRVESQRPDPSGRYADGEVMGQFPRPGRRAKPGREVLLTLSSGRRQVTVPDLSGSTLRQALGLLADVRLEEDTLARHWRHDPRFGEGTVLAQLPAAGDTLAPGDLVGLTLSLGPAPDWVPVPSLAGLPLGQAERVLERAGLVLGFVDNPLDREALVRSQEPTPGTPLVPGSAVDLRCLERSEP
jgi:beta-lactam-binding protein with PASTA domain